MWYIQANLLFRFDKIPRDFDEKMPQEIARTTRRNSHSHKIFEVKFE